MSGENDKNSIQNHDALMAQVELLSQRLGLPKNGEKTVLVLKDGENPEEKTLKLISGSWDHEGPWFLVDEKNKIHTVLPVEVTVKLIESLRKAQEENFNLKLEKSIWQNVPIDFEDVWVVAMEEIRKMARESKDKNILSINVDKLVKKIKKEHPNLFIDMQKLFLQQQQLMQNE